MTVDSAISSGTALRAFTELRPRASQASILKADMDTTNCRVLNRD